ARLQVALDLFHPHVRRHDEVRVLVAHLGEHGELAGQLFDQRALVLRLQRDRAVGHLDVAQPQLAQPLHEPLHPALPDRQLGERAAQHDRDAVRRVALELGLEVGAHERRAPTELDDVHTPAPDLQQAVHLGARQAAIDHGRQSPLTRLGGALGNVEKAGYGTVAALSRPTITTTVAEPASDATVASIGCACVTPSAWATLCASARCPLSYS